MTNISGKFPTFESGMVWPHEAAGRGRLLFLGQPTISQVEYSPRPRFRADGTWRRSWRTLPANDGVVLAEVSASCLSIGLVRYERPGKTHIAPISTLGGPYFDPGPLPTNINGLRSGRPQQHDGLAQAAWFLSDRTCIKMRRFDLQVVARSRA